MGQRKNDIVQALRKFASQRPGLEFANYGNRKSYDAEARGIARDLADANMLLLAVQSNEAITAQHLLDATRAYSGRLSIHERGERRVEIDYTTGQYFPTEYRRAVCAVLSSALWDNARENLFKDTESPGDAIRAHFKNQFGARMQKRWFD